MLKKITKTLQTSALAFAVAGSALLPQLAQADAYPERPVSMVVSYSPGGATDFQARIVTMLAGNEDYLGQPMVILNKPGAGGKVGWDFFASKAKKNGYELAAYNVPHFIAQSIVFKTKYNIDNLEPIANWGADPAVLIVGKDSPFNTLEDLMNYAKENPGKVTFSGAGLYVGHHIAYLQFAKASGLKLTYVPHKGGTPAMKSVMGGQVKAGFNNLSDAFRNRDSVKILAVADLERNKEFLPDVPTFMEQGVEVDDSSVNFRGIMARKGTPDEVVDYLAQRVPMMFEDKKTLKKMDSAGSPVRIIPREEVITMWKEREAYLKELLADLKK
ncbi:Bug family tripartite tricarboxylate transporter substrate binding protein [Aliamphritea hakodatensis]|uniref:Bug family tripartite tricarboxylate transporter substrate binding protein n=1 Tax=Aliamphritea hakodatensis TaxID=2895352 RepID=UPI0022FD5DC8|nr:tripartite tricarboxylate transporter substrate binding protein [Aliamphritea hakodatensis]